MRQLDDIQTLVERFLEGRTTNSEEQLLYEWFATADVPAEWADLKAMFAWYADGMPEREEQPTAVVALHPHRRLLGIAFTTVSIAAVLAIVLCVVLNLNSSVDIYEGSYIISEGVRYDDLDLIKSDIEAVLQRADNIEQQANELLAWADTI